jgi:hypothetical protein
MNQRRLKQDNGAKIVWANDSLKQATDYCIIYLHDFPASGRRNPVHRNIAAEFGCNCLCPLAEHGIDTSERSD